MSRPTRPVLVVRFDRENKRAVLRGSFALDAVAYVRNRRAARWSPSQRGWVVPAAVAVDCIAWAEYRHAIVRVTGEVTT